MFDLLEHDINPVLLQAKLIIHEFCASDSGVASPTIWSCYANIKSLSLFISLEIDCFHGLWTRKYLHSMTKLSGWRSIRGGAQSGAAYLIRGTIFNQGRSRFSTHCPSIFQTPLPYLLMDNTQLRRIFICRLRINFMSIKAHTEHIQFGNATQTFNLQWHLTLICFYVYSSYLVCIQYLVNFLSFDSFICFYKICVTLFVHVTLIKCIRSRD
jgi:hypothetical protein